MSLPPDDPTRSYGGDETPERLARVGLPDHIGRYRILGILGEGGMGIVYEAEQQEPRRKVALKVVRGGHVVDDVHVRMFQREAETLARLKHPLIGAIYEAGRTDDGRHFFAMELVRGVNPDTYLRSRGPVTDIAKRGHSPFPGNGARPCSVYQRLGSFCAA